MASTEVRPFWLVMDIRAAASDKHSGLARFVMGLSRALGESLATRQTQNDPGGANVRLLLVSKSEPPRWAIELIQEYPSLVSFWSGGPGALASSWEKPQYLWSSRVLRWILKWSRGQFFWIAPGNFDRPVLTGFLLPRALRHHVVQVIHDTIPIDHARSMSFLFRTQFSLLVKRTLAKFPFVFTVSDDSAERLAKLAPRRSAPVHVLPNGVEPIFGSLPRHRSVADLLSARRAFLDILFAGNSELSEPGTSLGMPSGAELDSLVRRRWIIGVGRSQKYKGWELAEDVIHQLHSDLSEGVTFIRIGGDDDNTQRSSKAQVKQAAYLEAEQAKSGFAVKRSDNGLVLIVESLPDEMLAQLYRCADVLLHPSQAEGFGFPPVEAALSGLPVVYRRGTAVDGHFQGHSFHPNFWQGIDSDDQSQWREAVLSVLRNKSGLDAFMTEMQTAVHPRSFICQRGGGQDFRWSRAADNLLSVLLSETKVGGATEGSE
ncbi:glycosyltransferase [bacterium]|nr:glycosyltransferase [bacterium]